MQDCRKGLLVVMGNKFSTVELEEILAMERGRQVRTWCKQLVNDNVVWDVGGGADIPDWYANAEKQRDAL